MSTFNPDNFLGNQNSSNLINDSEPFDPLNLSKDGIGSSNVSLPSLSINSLPLTNSSINKVGVNIDNVTADSALAQDVLFKGNINYNLDLTGKMSENNGDKNSSLTSLTGDIKSTFILDSGYFTVGSSGQVGVDFLLNGGMYKSDLGIFSLKGMDKFTPGSAEFIKEAAERSLSNSALGHTVISEGSEGAKFGARGGGTNDQPYKGVKTFAMTPGDTFAFMLVPNGTVQEVFNNPVINGDKRPLFSVVLANPNAAFHVGQIVDVTGSGKTFAFEDERVDTGSDKDYDDIVAGITGATGTTIKLDDAIEPKKDWRGSIQGKEVLDYDKSESSSDTNQLVETQPSSETTSSSDPKPSNETNSPVETKPFDNTNLSANTQLPVTTTSLIDTNPSEPTNISGDTKPSSDINSSIDTNASAQTNIATGTKPTDDISSSVNTQLPVTTTSSIDTIPSEPTNISTETKPSNDINSSIDTIPSEPTNISGDTKPSSDTTSSIDTKVSSETNLSVNSKPSVDIESSVNTNPADKINPSVETKPSVETNLSLDTQTLVETNQVVDTKPSVDANSSANTQPLVNPNSSIDTKPLDEITSSGDSKPLVEINSSVETKPPVETNSSTNTTISSSQLVSETDSSNVNNQAPIASAEVPNATIITTVDSAPNLITNNTQQSSLSEAVSPSVVTTEVANIDRSLPLPQQNIVETQPVTSSEVQIPTIPSQTVLTTVNTNVSVAPETATVNTTNIVNTADICKNIIPSVNETAANAILDGVFVVGNTGELSFDIKFDGGAYEGEMGIFSLAGMEGLNPDSPEFIEEASKRILSNSQQGHLVLADRIEGGKITGSKFYEGKLNDGQYLGVKTVSMKPGDRFAIMLVPKGTVQRVLDNPNAQNSLRPLFSIPTANPSDCIKSGQLADINRDGRTFGWEDLTGKWSDRDYNDIIFQMQGATGKVANLDLVINPAKDWRKFPNGQEFLAQITSNTQPPKLDRAVANITLTPAQNSAKIALDQIFTDPDSRKLRYEIVDGNGKDLAVVLEGDRLQLTKRAETGLTGLTNVAIRATDESGNSYIHSFTVVTSNLNQDSVSALNVALANLQKAMNFAPQDLTLGLSSIAGEKAIAQLTNVFNQHPGLYKLLKSPETFATIGVSPAGVATFQQLLHSNQFAADLHLTAEKRQNTSPVLADALKDNASSSLDLAQINAAGIAAFLANPQSKTAPPIYQQLFSAKQPQLAVIDAGEEHQQQVIETLQTVNPLIKPQIRNGNWANQLVEFVNELKKKGIANGIVNLSIDLTQIDSKGRVSTRYELTTQEQLALQYARENNVLLVVASGNTGGEMSALGRAAQEFDNIITIGATDQWGEPTGYSSGGNGLSLVAPGGEFEGEHNSFIGTSKATAYVAAAASLIWAINSKLSYQQLRELLTSTAVDLKNKGWDRETGAGLLNVEEAVRRAQKTKPEPLPSRGSVTVNPFSGEGRVQPGQRTASPATEKAIASLFSQQEALEAKLQLLGNTPELENKVDQQTANALRNFQQINTKAATLGAQAGQLSTALDLANQLHEVEQGRLTNTEERLQALEQNLAALRQESASLDRARQEQQTTHQERINQAQQALQSAQTDYNAFMGQVSKPPTPASLRQDAARYREQAQELAAIANQQRAIATADPTLKDRYLRQAEIARQTSLFATQLAAQQERLATLFESKAPESAIAAAYREQIRLAEQLRQQSQAAADWHQERLQHIAKTTGIDGMLMSSQREEHTRQRNLYEQIAAQAEWHCETGAYLGQPGSRQLALEDQVKARQIELQAEQDKFDLSQAKYEQDKSQIAQLISALETEQAILQAQRQEAETKAKATAERIEQIQAQLDALQDDWDEAQKQWQDYLNINSTFLPRDTRLAMAEQRLQALDAEKLRIEKLIADIKKQQAETPNENFKRQLEQASTYLQELAQEQLLAQVHKQSVDGSALNSSQRVELINQVEQLDRNLQTQQTQWQKLLEKQKDLATAIDETKATGVAEREQLKELRSQLTPLQQELTTATSQKTQQEQALIQAQKDLEFTKLQLENQEILLEHLKEQDKVLVNAEAFYTAQAEQQRQKQWYWNDRTKQYEYNNTEGELYRQSSQFVSLVEQQRNQIFQQIPQVQAKIAELKQQQQQQQAKITQLEAQLLPLNEKVTKLEDNVKELEAKIAPLATIVNPLVEREDKQKQALKTATEQTETALSNLTETASRQLAAYQRFISLGLLAAEKDATYFTTQVEPKVHAYIQEVRQQQQHFYAQNIDLRFDKAAEQLESQLKQATEAINQLKLQQELKIRQQQQTNATQLQALEALLKSENAAEAAIKKGTPEAYRELANTVSADLQQTALNSTQNFRTGNRFIRELGQENQQLSNAIDSLQNYIETQFANPNGRYYSSETELREAIALFENGIQRYDTLSQAVLKTRQDMELSQFRLAQDESLWEKIAPIAARYGVTSVEQYKDLYQQNKAALDEVEALRNQAINLEQQAQAYKANSDKYLALMNQAAEFKKQADVLSGGKLTPDAIATAVKALRMAAGNFDEDTWKILQNYEEYQYLTQQVKNYKTWIDELQALLQNPTANSKTISKVVEDLRNTAKDIEDNLSELTEDKEKADAFENITQLRALAASLENQPNAKNINDVIEFLQAQAQHLSQDAEENKPKATDYLIIEDQKKRRELLAYAEQLEKQPTHNAIAAAIATLKSSANDLETEALKYKNEREQYLNLTQAATAKREQAQKLYNQVQQQTAAFFAGINGNSENLVEAIASIQSQTLQKTASYQQQLANAKTTQAEKTAEAFAALNQAPWHEERAKEEWDLSKKKGPFWYEYRHVCKKIRILGFKVGWRCHDETITHIDYHWIAWENHENTAKSLRQQGMQALIAAEKARKEIECLEPLVAAWTKANEAADQADASVTDTQTLAKSLEAARSDIPQTRLQLELLEKLLPTLETQLAEAGLTAEVVRLNVEQAWQEYNPAAAEYRQAIADVLNQRGNWLLQADETRQKIAQMESWIEGQQVGLKTETRQVSALQLQLETTQSVLTETKKFLETKIQSATGDELIRLKTNLSKIELQLAEIEPALRMIQNKATLLTTQQTAFTQQQTFLKAQREVMNIEEQLLDAYIKSPDADTSSLKQQLVDARAVLAETQQLAEQAQANSDAITEPLKQLQTDLLAQNDQHLQAVKEAKSLVSQLLAATRTNADSTLAAAKAQQRLNDLEFQIITRLQQATKAGSKEAEHLLDVAKYNDLATAAEIYFRDYQYLANDQGKFGSGNAQDAILAEQYRQEMERYRALQRKAQAQVNNFGGLKDAAQDQIRTLEAEQTKVANELDRLNTQIANSQEQITAKQQALAIAQSKADALARARQQTEEAFIELVKLEQLNLAQAQLEQKFASQRKSEIDQSVKEREERDRLELERQRLEIQYQIEKLKQQQTNEELRQALNQVRADVGQFSVGRPTNLNNLETQLTGLQEQLEIIKAQQPNLPEEVKALLAEVQGDIDLALKGQEANNIQDKVIKAMEVLTNEAQQYKAQISQLEQQDQRDQFLLQLSQQNLQEAVKMLLPELEEAKKLQGEREIINPLYLQTLAKVAFAEAAVEMSQNMAKEAKEILDQIIKQRIEERKARKKAFWAQILGAVSSVIKLVGTILTWIPPLAPLGIALNFAGSAISAINTLIVTGDFMAALTQMVQGSFLGQTFQGIQSIVSGDIGLGVAQILGGSVGAGIYQGVKSVLSGQEIFGALQIISSLASVAGAAVGNFASGLSANVQNIITQIANTIETVPLMIYKSIEAIRNGDWLTAISNIFNSIVTVGKNVGNVLSDTMAQAFDYLGKIGNSALTITGAAMGNSLQSILNGLQGLADIWGDDIAALVADKFRDPIDFNTTPDGSFISCSSR